MHLQRRIYPNEPALPGDRADTDEFRWGRTLPIFGALIAAASVAIFNYQKLSSPVVASTLYALRTSARAREHLGDEIYFRRQIPWISGEMNQVRGRIDIAFAVRGSRASAVMRFASHRPGPRAAYETTEWSLVTDDGRVIDLLEDAEDAAAVGHDLFRDVPGHSAPEDEDAAGDGGVRAEAVAPTKGFRQQIK